MFYMYGDMKPVIANLVELSATISPAMGAAGEKFVIISIAPMGFILKTFYMGLTAFLVIYSIKNANETSKKQANLIFDTEKKAILEENMRLGMELDVARQLQAMVLPSSQEISSCKDLQVAAMMEAAAMSSHATFHCPLSSFMPAVTGRTSEDCAMTVAQK